MLVCPVSNGSVIYRDNPDAVCDVYIDLNANTIDGIKRAVRSIVGCWTTAPDDDIDVAQLTGGITNILYVVTNRTLDRKVVVRLYGAGTAAFIDRSTENFVFSRLSMMNIGPTFYGLFQNGRVEGYLCAMPVESSQMRNSGIYPHIAKAVAEIHSLDLQEIYTTGWVWQKIQRFLELAQATDGNIPHPLVSDMSAQLHWLRNYISTRASECDDAGAGNKQRAAGRRFGLQEVLCHNDLLSGNILLRTDPEHEVGAQCSGRQVFLIDYEYAAYNYRAFDIANHISEHCGFEYDFLRTLPNKDFVMAFLREYVLALEVDVATSGSADLEDFLLGLLDTVYWLLLASHLFWGSWSLVQARCSTIDFDYAGYAQRRYNAFLTHRTQYAPC